MKSFTLQRRQRGDALFEALIGLVLMAIVGLGLAYTSSRAINAQRYLNTQNLAITEVRSQLQLQTDLCDGTPDPIAISLANENFDFTPTCTAETIRISVADDVAPEANLSVETLSSVSTSETDATRRLFGGDGTLVINLQ